MDGSHLSPPTASSSATPATQPQQTIGQRPPPPYYLPLYPHQQLPPPFLLVDHVEKPQLLPQGQEQPVFIKNEDSQSPSEESMQKLTVTLPRFQSGRPISPATSDLSDSSTPASDDKALLSLRLPYDTFLKPTLQGRSLDAILSLPVSLRDSLQPYFYHFSTSCARTCFPFGSEELCLWWWQQAMNQPAFLFILLTTSAIHKSASETIAGGVSVAAQQSTQHALLFRVKAYEFVRQILNESETAALETTAFVVAPLICVEAADGNQQAADAHVQGLKKLVDLLGGIEGLDHAMVSLFYSAVHVYGLLTSSEPAFPMSEEWKQRVLQEVFAVKSEEDFRDHSYFGNRFFASPWSAGLDPSLRLLLQHFRQLMVHYNYAQSSLSKSSENNFALLTAYELLATTYVLNPSDFQDTLRIAMRIYLALRLWTFQGLPCMKFVSEELQHSLYTTLHLLQRTAPDLLFWILFVGGLASMGHQTSAWFKTYLSITAGQLAVYNWDAALVLLEGFCFIYRPADTMARDLWNAVQQRQEQEFYPQ
ncbi:uncharacterized protein BO66DRAFT_442150 [Aspergillus aculeatinus CBS 121060]|uniref:Uncharacterized protein n=1 Tax=Aspergillus aculeatinus CBS 121060 TaxID=1448322 RepID=A0ACD1GYU5_9EURO|nr:hypothetical protein BO66DRAFT_442150 [Aspergillus aculeatinus CBS 121060]RAH66351.1 hypothetical protein BO66DRAFT_442150 [Aspergillus aculeatinus CBS 121060]